MLSHCLLFELLHSTRREIRGIKQALLYRVSQKSTPVEISSFVVKRALSYLWEFIIASKTKRQQFS